MSVTNIKKLKTELQKNEQICTKRNTKKSNKKPIINTTQQRSYKILKTWKQRKSKFCFPKGAREYFPVPQQEHLAPLKKKITGISILNKKRYIATYLWTIRNKILNFFKWSSVFSKAFRRGVVSVIVSKKETIQNQ